MGFNSKPAVLLYWEAIFYWMSFSKRPVLYCELHLYSGFQKRKWQLIVCNKRHPYSGIHTLLGRLYVAIRHGFDGEQHVFNGRNTYCM